MPADRSSSTNAGSSKDDSAQPIKRPYAKANRSLRACDICHARKTRCSGDQPCTFCVSRGMKCVMSDDTTRGAASRSGSSRASRQKSSEQPSSHSSTSPMVSALPAPTTTCPTSANHGPNAQLPLPLSLPLPPPCFTAPHRGTTSPSSSTFYKAPGKPISPFKHPMSAEKATLPLPDMRKSAPPGHSSHSPIRELACPADCTIFKRLQRPQRFVKEADITRLLTKEKSNRYLDLYFSEAECIYQLWPVPSIIQHCHDVIWGDIAANEHCPDTPLPLGLVSTLTALLALGALVDHDMQDSEMLYHAARSCYLDITDGATLESVHLALQLAVFEINTKRSTSACNSLAVAVRIAQHLNLHRKTTVIDLSAEEALRHSQLWHTCFVQDCWLSMASGGPPLINQCDCDSQTPIYGPEPHQAPTFVSPFLHLLVRLSGIWNGAHAKLLQAGRTSTAEPEYSEMLSEVDTELRIWQRDIHQLYARLSVGLNRSERLHCQAVLLTFSSMRLTIHRFVLRRTSSGCPSEHYDTLQHVLSQNAILDSAMDITAYAKASLQLGMRRCFCFLGTSLYSAYLAMWEHLQTKQSPVRMDDSDRVTQGMSSIVWLVDHIRQSGDNAAITEVQSAIRRIQELSLRNPSISVEPPLLAGTSTDVRKDDSHWLASRSGLTIHSLQTYNRGSNTGVEYESTSSQCSMGQNAPIDQQTLRTPHSSPSRHSSVPRPTNHQSYADPAWVGGSAESERPRQKSSGYFAEQPSSSAHRWRK